MRAWVEAIVFQSVSFEMLIHNVEYYAIQIGISLRCSCFVCERLFATRFSAKYKAKSKRISAIF